MAETHESKVGNPSSIQRTTLQSRQECISHLWQSASRRNCSEHRLLLHWPHIDTACPHTGSMPPRSACTLSDWNAKAIKSLATPQPYKARILSLSCIEESQMSTTAPIHQSVRAPSAIHLLFIYLFSPPDSLVVHARRRSRPHNSDERAKANDVYMEQQVVICIGWRRDEFMTLFICEAVDRRTARERRSRSRAADLFVLNEWNRLCPRVKSYGCNWSWCALHTAPLGNPSQVSAWRMQPAKRISASARSKCRVFLYLKPPAMERIEMLGALIVTQTIDPMSLAGGN